MHYTEIVDADVCELRAACHLADSPYPGRGGLQSLVDFYVSTVGQRDAGQLQPKCFRIWSAACRHQHVAAFHSFLSSILLDDDAYGVSRFSRHTLDSGIQKNVDALILKQATKSPAHVFVFSGHQPLVAIDHRHLAAKSAHRLGQFYSDVAAADHK